MVMMIGQLSGRKILRDITDNLAEFENQNFSGYVKKCVLTEVWITLCVYLIVAYLNFKAKFDGSMQQIIRVLQLNLFERRALIDLFKPPNKKQPVSPQFLLWSQL